MLRPTTILAERNDAQVPVSKGNPMDASIERTDLSQYSSKAAVAVPVPEDDLAFFAALWIWIPVSLGLWATLVWTVTRFI